jgi:hypothetical protein
MQSKFHYRFHKSRPIVRILKYINSVHALSFLGAFAKLRKATINFVISFCPAVCPSARMEQLDSHWTDCHEILYLSIFLKPVEKIQVSLKSDKNSGYFT